MFRARGLKMKLLGKSAMSFHKNGPSVYMRSQSAMTGLLILRTLHPAVETRKDNKVYIRVLLYSFYTTLTGWEGGPPKQPSF